MEPPAFPALLRDIARFVIQGMVAWWHGGRSPKSLRNLRNRIQRGWKRPDLHQLLMSIFRRFQVAVLFLSGCSISSKQILAKSCEHANFQSHCLGWRKPVPNPAGYGAVSPQGPCGAEKEILQIPCGNFPNIAVERSSTIFMGISGISNLSMAIFHGNVSVNR